MLNFSFPNEDLEKIKEVMKDRRIVLNITQKQASELSGVNLETLRRFEQKGEISLLNLLKLFGLYKMTNRVMKSITDRSWWSIEQLEKSEKRKRAR